jgi:hypothetical protein
MARSGLLSAVTSGLTVRTREVGAAAVFDSDDGSTAARAGLALPVVDLVTTLVTADDAKEVAVLLIGEGAAPMLDGIGEDVMEGAVEASNFVGRQRIAPPIEPQAGGEENFVGVDVAEAGEDPLVHEERLQHGSAAGEERRERLANGEIEGIHAEVVKFGDVGRGDEHLTEGPRVDEAQLRPGPVVRVTWVWGGRGASGSGARRT